MSAKGRLNRIGPHLERALENEYAQERLREAALSARAAYKRAAGRKAAKAAQDKRFQRQVREAALSLREAAAALRSGRKKPKRRRAPRVIAVVGIAGAAGLAAREGIRRQQADGAAAQPTEPPVTA